LLVRLDHITPKAFGRETENVTKDKITRSQHVFVETISNVFKLLIYVDYYREKTKIAALKQATSTSNPD